MTSCFVHLQLFAYFMETHEAEVLEAKARGTFDEGVVSLTAESVTMSAGYPRVVHTDEQSGATTQLCRISIDRYVYFYLHTGNSTDVVFVSQRRHVPIGAR